MPSHPRDPSGISADWVARMRAHAPSGGITSLNLSSMRDMENLRSPRVRPSMGSGRYYDSNNEEENNIMATVGSMVGHNPDVTSMVPHPMIVGTGKVGIEVELERTTRRNMRYWNSISDASLRDNGVEYVLSQPLGGRDLQAAIFELDTNMHEVAPNASWRCSTHIHLDVRDMTVPQLKKFILAYTALERIIFQCSGIQRWDNNFCPSFGFAESQVTKLSRIWKRNGRNFVQALDTSGEQGDRDKYSSLNFLPIRRQGSVEFRGAEAKFRKGQLLRLANRVLSLRELAITFEGSETELIQFIANNHPSKVLKKSMPSKYVLDQAELHSGCDLAMDIIHLGNLSQRRVSSDPELRTRWASEWLNRFGHDKPDRILSSRLHQLCEENDCWAGDFIHATSVEDYTSWAEQNGIEY